MLAQKCLGRVEDEFTLKDVGSTLLQELAKGIYIPAEVIREYVQNAVDAHRLWKIKTGNDPEGPLQIEIRGNKISIFDYGIGMNLDEVKDVKSIAVSKKTEEEVRLTGYKGVGIWAGLSYFDNLTLYTTKRGVDRAYQLTINFKRIVESIDYKVDIGEVLNRNYQIDEFEADKDEHFTIITLEEPTRSKDEFLDSDKTRDVVRRICPCPIDPTFRFCKEVTEWYAQNNFDLHEILVNGESVYRSYPSVVDNFETEAITINDQPVAVYWKAVHQDNKMLPCEPDQLVGFRVVQDGFLIDENLYSERRLESYDEVSLHSYLYWYIGDIYVIAEDLRPDLPRRGFEESELTRQFIKRLRQWYQNLANETRIMSRRRNFLTKYAEYEKGIKDLDPLRVIENETWLLKISSELKEHEEKVEANRRKRKPPEEVQALRDKDVKIERRRILSSIKKLLDQLSPETVGTMEKKEESSISTAPYKTREKEKISAATSESEGSEVKQERPDHKLSEVPGKSATIADQPRGLENIQVDSFTVSLETLLAILEEELDQEFGDNPQKISAVLSRLQFRINALAGNV
jgi:hypothetical protein